jgi:hypothetical protein
VRRTKSSATANMQCVKKRLTILLTARACRP